MNTIFSNEKNFTKNLETFKNYTGLCNTIQLSILGYQHYMNDIIKCNDCHVLFITWSNDDSFFEKHKQSLCFHMLDMNRVSENNNLEDLLKKWKKKSSLTVIQKENDFTDETFENILKEYIKLKGEFGNLRTFKEYINYVKYFK